MRGGKILGECDVLEVIRRKYFRKEVMVNCGLMLLIESNMKTGIDYWIVMWRF